MIKNEQKSKDEISLKELIESGKEWYYFLLTKWKTIFIAGVIGGVLGLGYAFSIKPTYTAALTFALEDDKSGGSGGVLSLASQFGLSLGSSGGGIFEGSNLNELFKSRTMVEETLMKPVFFQGDTISLAEMYIQNNEWREYWNKKPKFKNIQFLPDTKRKYFTRAHDSILGKIYENLIKTSLYVGQKDKKISIITMEVTSTNELFSKFFCENLARQVGVFYITTKTKKSRTNMEILVL